MKSTIRILTTFFAMVFLLAAAAQLAGLFTIPGIPVAALLAGVLFCGLVLFALGDYSRKPAFRVRRSTDPSVDAGPTVNRPAGQSPDWTYTTRAK